MTDLSAFPITKRWPAQNPDIIQLYSYPTPNGVKVSIALEEMGLAYEPHLVTLADSDVKSPEFLSLNPNNKIPAIIDPNGPDGAMELWESGAILIYLAEKFGKLIGSNGGFACIICHANGKDKATAAFEVEGINFDQVAQRLRRGYYHNWMENPQSITPTTKMPRYTNGNISPFPDYDKNAEKQFEAIGEYLKSLGK